MSDEQMRAKRITLESAAWSNTPGVGKVCHSSFKAGFEAGEKYKAEQAARAQSEEPDWNAVRGKRMCDLTEQQYRDAWELWIREQIGYMYSNEHMRFLLERLDEARTYPPARERVPSEALDIVEAVCSEMTSISRQSARSRDNVLGWMSELRNMLAAAPQPHTAVSESWKLVPVEPTPEMLMRGTWSGNGDVGVDEEWARKVVYQRMLAASPEPPEE